jgi:Fem-1 family protein b
MSFQSSAIDDEELVHNVARQGHVFSLEIYLNQNPKCINKLFTYHQSKWTPLLVSCFYKHEHVVRMLLTRFKPDIEAVGTVTLHPINNRSDLAEEVSPLWTAAAVNHFDIVKLLIKHGNANTNHLTKTHSTALRAACYHNNLEMIRYLIEHHANPYQAKEGNYTNLMLSAGRQHPLIVDYLVNQIKCDINERDENGQTALYYSVRSKSIEITKFLLEHGALNIRDKKRKVTPLMRAALFGEINLVNAFEGYCSDIEWIEAKELFATSFAGFISRIENPSKTIEYLTEAFQLRQAKNLPKQLIVEPLEILHYRRECETLEQLNQLLCSNIKDALFIETILIHQRLLGDDHVDYHDAIHYYGVTLAHNHQYHDCFRSWFYEFDLKQKYNIPFETNHLHQFIHLFAKMKFTDHLNIPIEDLLRMFNIMNYVFTSDHNIESFDLCLIILLRLITIVARIMYSEDLEEKQELSIDHRRDLYKAIRYVIRHQYVSVETGSSLLHLCINSSTKKISVSIR